MRQLIKAAAYIFVAIMRDENNLPCEYTAGYYKY